MDALKMTFQRLIAAQQTTTFRFLYEHFTLQERLIGLIGPRGVGKTTLLLQIIKTRFPDLQGVFYFSADHFYFNTHTLYEFIDTLYQTDNITTVFIDEIHKYPNWNQELKNIYDSFPMITVIFSGSSSLDLVKASYDLSRRAHLLTLPGLSFREYLNFTTNQSLPIIKLEELLLQPLHYNNFLSSIPQLKGHFKKYLSAGYYPFFLQGSASYYDKLLKTIEKTIFEDIASFYKLKTQNLILFKKILTYFATIEPGTVNQHNLAKNLSVDSKTVAHYLSILEETNLIRIIHPYAKGNPILRKPEKIFLNNTTLNEALLSTTGQPTSIGLTRELFFLQNLQNAHIGIFYSDIGDYRTQTTCFEIGGKNKTRKQLQASTIPSFLVKEDIFFATQTELPLYLFGFLY